MRLFPKSERFKASPRQTGMKTGGLFFRCLSGLTRIYSQHCVFYKATTTTTTATTFIRDTYISFNFLVKYLAHIWVNNSTDSPYARFSRRHRHRHRRAMPGQPTGWTGAGASPRRAAPWNTDGSRARDSPRGLHSVFSSSSMLASCIPVETP